MAKAFRCSDFKGERRASSCEEHDSFITKKFNPLAHQARFATEWINSSKRGMLEFWSLGSGKSCGAIMAVDGYIKKYGHRQVYFISPAAIRSSFIGEYCSSCGALPEEFHKTFAFLSYNDSTVLNKLPYSFDNCIVIVDECHRVINGRKNQSKIPYGIYEKIYNSKNSRVILLSGTPLWSSRYDLALTINLLNPGAVPIDKTQFANYSLSEKGLLQSLQGLISYVPMIDDPSVYPSYTEEDIKVPMSTYQFSIYKEARIKELERRLLPTDGKKKNDPKFKAQQALAFITRTMIQSRQRCNFVYPPVIQEALNKEHSDRKKKGSFPSDLDAKWITEDDTIINNLETYSPKFREILNRVILRPGKHMIYSFFKNHYGVYMLYRILKHCRISCLYFTGDLNNDTQRNEVLRKFNQENNKSGGIYKVLLISGAGSVGITVCSVRHCHIVEPEINNLIIKQTKGRVRRFLSHAQLEEKERTVAFYNYFSVLPMAFEENKTADEITVEVALKKEKEIEYYTELMKRAAFDCKENYGKNCTEYEKGAVVNSTLTLDDDLDDVEFDEDGNMIEKKTVPKVEEEDEDLEFLMGDDELEFYSGFI